MRADATMKRLFALFLPLGLSLWLSGPAVAMDDARFAVVSEDAVGDVRKVAVRLQDRVPEAALKSMAETIRIKAPAGKTPSRITFYLPQIALAQSPWAEVTFAPETHVSINGLRYEEVAAFATEAARDGRDILGVWLTAAPALAGKLTIWRDTAGKRFAEWVLKSGKKTVDELDEIKTSRGRRFEIKGSNGGYYLATWAGPLELGEGKTVIASAERLMIDKTKTAAPAAAPGSKPEAAAAAALPAKSAASSAADPAAAAPPVTAKVRHAERRRALDNVGATKPHSDPQSLADAVTGYLSR